MNTARAALLLCGVALMCGCTDRSTEPTPQQILTFPHGRPNERFSEDEWVTTVEKAQVAHASAVNSADFSSPELLELWSESRVDSMVGTSRGELLRGTPVVWLGPRAFEALEVREARDGRSAEIVGCAADPEVVTEVPWPSRNARVMPFTYLVELSPDGQRRVVGAGKPAEPAELADGRLVTDELCGEVELRRAVFDPAPDSAALAAKSADDVVVPSSPGPWDIP